MTKAMKPIPEGYHTLTPVLVIRGAAEAIAFYQRAFGAAERFRMAAPDGKAVGHAEIRIGDSTIMLGDEVAHQPCRSATSLGGSPVGLYLYVPDADAAFKRAVEAGAEAKMPPRDMFWGDRIGQVADPFGYTWTLATHIEDLTYAEIEARARKAHGPQG